MFSGGGKNTKKIYGKNHFFVILEMYPWNGRGHDLGILDVSLDQRVMTPANHPPNN